MVFVVCGCVLDIRCREYWVEFLLLSVNFKCGVTGLINWLVIGESVFLFKGIFVMY